MEWTIPGTVLTAPKEEAAQIPEQFRAMFMAGGMVLSQVAAITGLESYMIQNWVKRGFLTNPQNKRYTLRQLCRIININMLKSVLPMERICGLMAYINGHLDDHADDMITDSELYHLFVSLLIKHEGFSDFNKTKELAQQLTDTYKEPLPGAKKRLCKVLEIMTQSYYSAELKRHAEILMCELD